jgi:23S rRNA (guanosine2251-2'-O)-methyltransferase
MQDSDMIMGVNPIFEFLKIKPKNIIKVFSSVKEAKGKKLELLQLIKKKNIPLQMLSKEQLTAKCSSESHQGFCALIKPRTFPLLQDFLKKKKSTKDLFLVLLDQLTDPQNIGAIMRACECFQVDGLILPKQICLSMPPSISKASAGALDLITVIQANNSLSAVKLCQQEGVEAVCTTLSPKAKNLFSFSYPKKTLLVLGSEGKGISHAVEKIAKHHVQIPIKGKIDSLNVSQAAAICLSRIYSRV